MTELNDDSTPPCEYAGGKHDFRSPLADGTYRCSAPGCYATGMPPHIARGATPVTSTSGESVPLSLDDEAMLTAVRQSLLYSIDQPTMAKAASKFVRDLHHQGYVIASLNASYSTSEQEQ